MSLKFKMTLPNELVEKILLNLPYQDIISFPKLNFSFWRDKAEKDFGVQGWYFNLYCNSQDSFINREISGRERYLEIWKILLLAKVFSWKKIDCLKEESFSILFSP